MSHHCQSCVKGCDVVLCLNASNGWQLLKQAISQFPLFSPLPQHRFLPTFPESFNYKIKGGTLETHKNTNMHKTTKTTTKLILLKVIRFPTVVVWVQLPAQVCSWSWEEGMIPFGNLNIFRLLHTVIGIIMKKTLPFAVLWRAYFGVSSFQHQFALKRKSYGAMSERETFFKALWITHWRCLHSSVS